MGGGDVNNNCSYLQNPDFPSATASPSTYAYNINKLSDGETKGLRKLRLKNLMLSDICYIRLDFEVFTLVGTGVSDKSNGCSQDSLTISVSARVSFEDENIS